MGFSTSRSETARESGRRVHRSKEWTTTSDPAFRNRDLSLIASAPSFKRRKNCEPFSKSKRKFPSSAEEGWLRHHLTVPFRSGADGVVLVNNQFTWINYPSRHLGWKRLLMPQRSLAIPNCSLEVSAFAYGYSAELISVSHRRIAVLSGS
jgi:hypothetical protein